MSSRVTETIFLPGHVGPVADPRPLMLGVLDRWTPTVIAIQTIIASVVPRARHCGIPAILPSMSLKNEPSAGLQARPKNPLIFRYLNPVSVFSVT